MKFTTKFETGDIAAHKFDKSDPKGSTVYQIMEIHIQRCYTTTQVFYLARPIIIVRDGTLYDPGKATAHLTHGDVKNGHGGCGWTKMREDELEVPHKKIVEFLKKLPPVDDTVLTSMENTLNPPKEKK